mmetsp:Transcript_81118/g.161309  ORF Transcript_81118/g.161309 Transcript_81118/m.161309 type:complete len:149 (-) Transcript_81118:160-606(-)
MDVPQPQILLFNTLRLLRAPRALCSLAVALLNDGARCDACMIFPVRELVAGAIGIASEALRHPLPVDWLPALEVDDSSYRGVCHALLGMFDAGDPSHEEVRLGTTAASGTNGPPWLQQRTYAAKKRERDAAEPAFEVTRQRSGTSKKQ